jgi:hypothetical protein
MAEGQNRLEAQTHRKNSYIGMDNRYGYLQFMYHNPVTNSNVPFPSGTPVNIIYVDNGGAETPHSGNPLSLDAQGKITFLIEHRTNLYFEFNFDQRTYINITSNTRINDSAISNLNTQTNMAFMLPQRFNLKNSTWTIDSVPVYDSPTRTFRDLEANPLSGASGHLPVVLTPEWQYIGFQFYDQHAKTQRMVPQYLMLYGYNEDVSEDNWVTSSNVFKDNCICLPWIEDRNLRNTRNREKIVLKFGTTNAYVDNGAGAVRRTRSSVRAMPLKDRFKHYDLPESWSSKNWKAKLGANSSNLLPFQNAGIVNGNSTSANPIVFELDTVVITNSDLEYESDWEQNNHFSFFNINMSINNPQTNRPYWTQGPVDRNFFPMGTTGNHPRVLAVNGRFHDITDKRSAGDLLGARAAVLNDTSVHYGEEVIKPYHSVAGNIELHYFADTLDLSDNVVSSLLVYWSCEFAADTGVTDAQIENFRRSGMTNAKNRWERKGYKFKRRPGSSGRDIEVRPVFFYEFRDSDPHKCDVTVHSGGAGARSSMGRTSGDFMANDYGPNSNVSSENGQSFGWFTMSHEIGHAMGLMDEYVESLEEDTAANLPHGGVWSPVLPIFDQPFIDGRPYPWDDISMMNTNKAPRLRMFWHYARWMNQTDEVKNLTGNTVFNVEHTSQNFKYFRSDSMTNFYEPVHSENNVENGGYAEFDLRLYKMGEDESTKIAIPGQSGIDGILVVRSRLQWFFDDYSSHTWQNIEQKLLYLKDFQTKVNRKMNIDGKFYLECPSDSDFKKVFVFFAPHYYFEGSTIHDHFEISVKANGGASINFQPPFYGNGYHDNEFEVDALQNKISIYRYVLGMLPYTMSGTNKVANNNISMLDLDFLLTWISNVRGGEYTMARG